MGQPYLKYYSSDEPKAGDVGSDHSCRVTKSAGQSIPSATDTIVTFDTETYDTDSYHSTVSNTGRMTFTSATAGKYLIIALSRWATLAAATTMIVKITLNGSEIARAKLTALDSGALQCDTILEVVDGDYVEMVVNQNDPSSRTLNNVSTFFAIQKVDRGG